MENLDDEIRRLGRASRRAERFPEGPACERCWEYDTRALKPGRTLCEKCERLRRNQNSTQMHHVAGRHNSTATTPVGVNEHQILTDMQNDWPEKTLMNPERSPLRAASANLRGALDQLTLIIERMLGWIPRALEALDGCLENQLGAGWWRGAQFQPFMAEVPQWVTR
jgi:hypothetical protein